MMTQQEIFDKVVTHVLNQKERCYKNKQCFYKLEGNSCAVGCLIPNHLYYPNLEGKRVGPLFDWSVIPDCDKDRDQYLLFSLQKAHDDVRERDGNSLQNLACIFNEIAREHKLKFEYKRTK